MAAANNNANRNSTLPAPELNPLLNPVLGAHMGRWAEVYFTSAPEKREEAVLELLRELEGGAGTPRDTAGAPDHDLQEPTKLHSDPPAIENIEEEQEWIVCESCGGTSVLGNRFCGMCGAPLANTASAESPRAASLGSLEREQYSRDRQDRYEDDLKSYGERPAPYPQDLPHSSWPPRPDVPSLIPEYEPAPYRYRMYVGAAVAILIGGLLYVAWRGSAASSGSSRQLPQSPPATEMQPAIQQSPSPGQVNAAPVPASSESAAADRIPAADSVQPHRISGTASKKNAAAPPRPASDQSVATPIVAPLQGNGSEELMVAEAYLNGTQGRMRDSGEAAKWLWRSIGKQNAAATLLLSDLYLRGDGVPKSCDQARLLLDAAARKGAAGAAQRIRNLPSVGCQ